MNSQYQKTKYLNKALLLKFTKSDDESYHPKFECKYAGTKVLNDEAVDIIKTKVFGKIADFFEENTFNPEDNIVQHMPVKEIEEEVEINRMRNGNLTDSLISVHIQKFVKNDVKMMLGF